MSEEFSMTDAMVASWKNGVEVGMLEERKRIIKLLEELGAIRRDALGELVAFNTDGTEVIYLTGLENK